MLSSNFRSPILETQVLMSLSGVTIPWHCLYGLPTLVPSGASPSGSISHSCDAGCRRSILEDPSKRTVGAKAQLQRPRVLIS